MGTAVIKITKAGATRTFGAVDTRERIEYAFGAADDRMSERVTLATVWRDAGYSIRGAVAGVTVAFNGATPDGFNKSSVGRAYIVADIVNPRELEEGQSAPLAHIADDGAFAEVVAGLLSVAKHGKGATETALSAYLAARTHAAGIKSLTKAATDSKAVQAALEGATARPTAGITNVTATDDDDATDDAPTATAPTGTNGTPGLMSIATARLITELSRRSADEWSDDDLAAFDALAMAVESIATDRDETARQAAFDGIATA